ncbi:MAG: hypothetical protein QX196_07300 [Methylococcaceae bacterium]
MKKTIESRIDLLSIRFKGLIERSDIQDDDFIVLTVSAYRQDGELIGRAKLAEWDKPREAAR